MKRVERVVKSRKNIGLNANDILVAEFEYISQTVFQTNKYEERIGGIINLLITVATASAGFLLNNQTFDKTLLFPFLSILSIILTIVGTIAIAELARLRAAWHESVLALTQIQNYYIKDNPDLEAAFRWRSSNIPPADQPFSIANLLALEITLVGAITSASAVYFLLIPFGDIMLWGWALIIISFIIGIILQWWWYKHLLVDNQ